MDNGRMARPTLRRPANCWKKTRKTSKNNVLQGYLFIVTTIYLLFQQALAQIYPDSYILSEKCSYLKLGDGQPFNAYLTGNELLCCMCGKGTEWAGDCNLAQPNTTLCNKCHHNEDDPYDRFYMHFEPHLQTECFRKPVKHCVPPQVYEAGTVREGPKCVCPNGMEKSRKGCVARPTWSTTKRKKTTPNQRNTVKTESKTKEPDSLVVAPTRGDTTVAITAPTTMAAFTNNAAKREQVTVKYSTTYDHSDEAKTENGPGNNITLSPTLAVVIVLLLAFLLLAYCCWRRRNDKKRGASGTFENSRDSSRRVSKILELSSSLGFCTKSTEEQIEIRQSENPEVGNMAVAFTAPQRNNRDAADGVHQGQPLLAEHRGEENAPRLPNASHINEVNNQRLPQTAYSSRRRFAPQNAHPVSTQEQIASTAQLTDGVLTSSVHANQRLTKAKAEKNKKFALNVGLKLGDELARTNALPTFRHIVGAEYETRLTDACNKANQDTPELFYQLMLLAMQIKGNALTPEYLLQMAKSLRPFLGRLVDVIEGEMKELYMTQPAAEE